MEDLHWVLWTGEFSGMPVGADKYRRVARFSWLMEFSEGVGLGVKLCVSSSAVQFFQWRAQVEANKEGRGLCLDPGRVRETLCHVSCWTSFQDGSSCLQNSWLNTFAWFVDAIYWRHVKRKRTTKNRCCLGYIEDCPTYRGLKKVIVSVRIPATSQSHGSIFFSLLECKGCIVATAFCIYLFVRFGARNLVVIFFYFRSLKRWCFSQGLVQSGGDQVWRARMNSVWTPIACLKGRINVFYLYLQYPGFNAIHL